MEGLGWMGSASKPILSLQIDSAPSLLLIVVGMEWSGVVAVRLWVLRT